MSENYYDIDILILYTFLDIYYLQFVGGENPEKKKILLVTSRIYMLMYHAIKS